jgi:3-methyladenine DNA glycosylase/8-oxoguanine DNA glycosylase
LAPFAWSDQTETLSRPLRLQDGACLPVTIACKPRARSTVIDVRVSDERVFSGTCRQEVRRQVTRMLRLDEDLAGFHRLCKTDPGLIFVANLGCGHMLRSPDAFEDLVKTICTTNCDWRNTKKMCEALCGLDGGGFPRAETLLRLSAAKLGKSVPLGYRTRTVLEAAKLFSTGKLPLDAWAATGDFQKIRSSLRGIWGVGPYCATHMLALLGCYEAIPVDSEVLRYLRETHFCGALVTAREAVNPYEHYGKWRYLAYKFGRIGRKMNYVDK